MANVYKNIQAKITPAGSYHDMYETPTETTSLIKSIKLYNTHSGALDVDIKVYDSSGSTDYEWDTVNINARKCYKNDSICATNEQIIGELCHL